MNMRCFLNSFLFHQNVSFVYKDVALALSVTIKYLELVLFIVGDDLI